MSNNQDYKVDKTTWPKGPWKEEPDRVEWRYKDYPCLIVRGPMGALCGYAAVTDKHPYYGVDCGDYDKVQVDVHGGVTYADRCAGHICHVPKDGETDNVWWLGFDCSHYGDFLPVRYSKEMQMLGPSWTKGHDLDTYRDIGYVKKEVESLVDQLIEAIP